jgi:hypothetical protein
MSLAATKPPDQSVRLTGQPDRELKEKNRVAVADSMAVGRLLKGSVIG